MVTKTHPQGHHYNWLKKCEPTTSRLDQRRVTAPRDDHNIMLPKKTMDKNVTGRKIPRGEATDSLLMMGKNVP